MFTLFLVKFLPGDEFDKCNYFIKDIAPPGKGDYESASNFCVEYGGNLAQIKNLAQQMLIFDLISQAYGNQSYVRRFFGKSTTKLSYHLILLSPTKVIGMMMIVFALLSRNESPVKPVRHVITQAETCK